MIRHRIYPLFPPIVPVNTFPLQRAEWERGMCLTQQIFSRIGADRTQRLAPNHPRTYDAPMTEPKDFTLPFAELPPVEAEHLPVISDLQLRFVEQYLIDLNGRRAAMRVGATYGSSASQASQWLKDPAIAQHVAYGQWEIRQRLHLAQDRVVRELMTLATSNIANYNIDDAGFVELAPGAPQDAMAAVAKMKRVVRYDEDGNKTITTDLALWDKPGSLKQLADHTGMNIKRIGNPDGTPLAGIEELRKAMLRGD